MGWISGLAVNGFLTVVVIGVLKRSGVIKVEPRMIKNDTARTMFEAAVDLGESVAEKGEKFWSEVTRK